jgi:hypothetical protein
MAMPFRLRDWLIGLAAATTMLVVMLYAMLVTRPAGLTLRSWSLLIVAAIILFTRIGAYARRHRGQA